MECVLGKIAPPTCSSEELKWDTGSSYEEMENIYNYHCNKIVSIILLILNVNNLLRPDSFFCEKQTHTCYQLICALIE